jgi:nucleoid-associated protein YgaU
VKRALASGVIAVVLSGVPSICGQSLGDIARQDRQRRAHLSSHPPVLTNEDLARDQILTPELRYRILAAYGAETGPPPPLDGSALATVATPFSRMAAAISPEVAAAPEPEIPAPDAIFVASVEQLPAGGEQGKELVGKYTPPIRESESELSSVEAGGEPASLGEFARQLRAGHTARDNGFDEEVLNVQPPPIAQAEEAISLGEYARQLRSERVARDNGLDVEVQTVQPPAVAQAEEGISLGEYARQLRSERVARDNGLDVEVQTVQPPAVAQAEEGISLGEYARQLRSERVARDNGLDVEVQTVPPAVAQAEEGISLGEYARQLQAVRSLPPFESAALSPVPPPISIRDVNAEVSLGEYARQARVRRSAEEYSRLLQADEPLPATASLAPAELAPSLSSAPIPALAVHETPVKKTARVRRASRPTPRMVAAAVRIGTLAGTIAVTVRRGDSLWRLARTYLGSGARWKSMSFLRSHPGSPDLIYEGEVVLIPVPDGQTPPQSAANRHSRQRPLP